MTAVKLTTRPIYLTIMAASEAGAGVRLSAAEVQELAQDAAIVTRAAVELEDDDEFVTNPVFTWVGALADWKRRSALQEASRD